MSELRDHSLPCPVCGWLMPLLVDGFPVQRVACPECGGAGGAIVTGQVVDISEWGVHGPAPRHGRYLLARIGPTPIGDTDE